MYDHGQHMTILARTGGINQDPRVPRTLRLARLVVCPLGFYIELNPVRASMVPHPRDYPWSSYRANGDLRPSALVTPHDGYIALGETPEQRAAAYRRLFQFELDEEDLKEIRSAANGGFALGNQRFKDEISAMPGRRVERLRPRLRQRASQLG